MLRMSKLRRVAVDQQEERRHEQQDEQRSADRGGSGAAPSARRPAPSSIRQSRRAPLGHVEEHVLERRLDHAARRRRRCLAACAGARRPRAGSGRSASEHRVHGGAEMLVFSTSGIASSALHRARRPRGAAPRRIGRDAKICFSSVDGAERRQPAGLDDGDAMAVLGLVQVVRGHEHGDAGRRRDRR